MTDDEQTARQDELIALRQQLDELRGALRSAEDRAARQDPLDPRLWKSRAERIVRFGGRAARAVVHGRRRPTPLAAGDADAPSSFERWSARMDGSRFVGFPVDWRFSRVPVTEPAAVAAVVHCHFPELLDELLAGLSVIDEPFDLYVTNSSGTPISAQQLRAAGARHVEVLTVENHGRDIWPMLQLVNAGILDPYPIVLKVHTKQSAWRAAHQELEGDGASWRASLLGSMLGSRENVSSILAALRADPDLAVVTADGSIAGPEHWGGDLELVRGIYRRLSMPLDPDALRFPAGSMYWIRGFVLQGLRAFRFDRDDFEPEAGQVDGTCAHAVERMIGLLSEEAGMRVITRSEVPESPGAPCTAPRARLVPFYLPQFHRVAENDKWWGKGFTEWYNVAKTTPLYPGHDVPLRPTELGFYSLELDSVREQQAELAADHGVAGFMYYYYWFAGRRLLELPIERLLASDTQQPFCIMWANENWTRRWDGGDTDVLIGQEYETVPPEDFIEDVMPLLRDPRYLRSGGAVVLAVYKLAQLPDPAATVERWRQRCREEGVGELLLLQVDVGSAMGSLREAGALGIVDGSLDFAPHNLEWVATEIPADQWDPRFEGRAMSYRAMVDAYDERLSRLASDAYPGAMVTFDNTARRQWLPDLFTGTNPYTFRRWLAACAAAVADREPDARMVFVNAWNEWAESAVLEPTEQYGRSYLQACRSAVGIG
ncbi:glycoside hydrolase family 99-like domain-containing protein [Agrococcus sp. Marseille-P2731]|uniref:glycoside hydrolase family 99-like domain-containing protein n=1 Tax=Agrococcus sp. Marseille-P2731 TaxID=1841862 RepID=UPI000A906AB0|nr:glycoside hydrolase family 99-like domain-containing protein [Agrococcus sp. Marseille-P2731]